MSPISIMALVLAAIAVGGVLWLLRLVLLIERSLEHVALALDVCRDRLSLSRTRIEALETRAEREIPQARQEGTDAQKA